MPRHNWRLRDVSSTELSFSESEGSSDSDCESSCDSLDSPDNPELKQHITCLLGKTYAHVYNSVPF